MSENLLYMAIAAFVIGVVLFAISNKQRQDTGEWSNTLQWGYLLMMIGRVWRYWPNSCRSPPYC
jgi:signal peptidase I